MKEDETAPEVEQVDLPDSGVISILKEQPQNPAWNLLLAHGAGAGMEHAFLSALSKALLTHGFRVIRFNFPYKERGKKMPGSPKEAIRCWERMVLYVRDRYPEQPLFVSGKSYGGRMASLLLAQAENVPVKGSIYYGFPLHAPGKPAADRAAHLSQIRLPQLFLQGTKDKLADTALIRQVVEPLNQTTLITFENADHSFKVPKAMGVSAGDMVEKLAEATAKWTKKTVENFN